MEEDHKSYGDSITMDGGFQYIEQGYGLGMF